jgi:hypothetical protein
MQIREYQPADLDRIKELHRQSGFRYALPDFSGQEFISRRVVGDESDIGMAGFLRLTAEAFLVCSPDWRTAAWRDLALRKLHTVCREDAAGRGVSEVNAFLPPEIVARFGARLVRSGWKRYPKGQEWSCFSFEV